MNTANSIILPIDFSTPSLASVPLARRVAESLNATIHCVYVVEEHQVYSMLDMPVPIQVPSTHEISEIADERLGKFVDEKLHGLDVPIRTKVLIGRPSEEIVVYAEEVGAEMIVMATHGHSGLEHVLLGSTTEAVLRHAKCPVLSIRAT